MSAASPLTDTAHSPQVQHEEEGPVSEPSRPTSPWHRPPAPMRDTLNTLSEEDFDFHDTIPAPPWLDEFDESSELPALTAR